MYICNIIISLTPPCLRIRLLLILLICLTGITKMASKQSQETQEMKQRDAAAVTKPAVNAAASVHPSNGQIHAQYHGYFVKAEVMSPPPDDLLGIEEDLHPSCLARLPPQPKRAATPVLKSLPAPSPSPVPPKESTKVQEPAKLKRQETIKSKSLAETKKASMDVDTEVENEESVSLDEALTGVDTGRLSWTSSRILINMCVHV